MSSIAIYIAGVALYWTLLLVVIRKAEERLPSRG